MPAGDRRMANVRKLMRMAREFEAEEGRDLRGFIDFVAERDLIAEREGQAPLEAEDLDAVRLMTIHRAKGLEFPVVCVADLGKDGREDDTALRITDDGRVGIRLASLGGGADRRRRARRDPRGAEARGRGGGAADLLRGGDARAGAPGPQRRHRPREARRTAAACRSRCAGSGAVLAPGPAATRRVRGSELRRPRRCGCAAEVLRPSAVDELLPAARSRPGAPRARAARARRARRARAGRGADPRRAAREPAELLRPGGLRPLRLPLLPRARR